MHKTIISSQGQRPLLISKELGLFLNMVLLSLKISNGHDDSRRDLHNLYLAKTGTSLYQLALDNSVEDRAFIRSPLPAKNPVAIQFALLAIGMPTNKRALASLLSSCSSQRTRP